MKSIYLRKGEQCKKCQTIMHRKGHKEIGSKQLKQPYYFKEWDICPNRNCGMIQMYEEFKIWNTNDIGLFIKSKEEEKSLFDSIVEKE